MQILMIWLCQHGIAAAVVGCDNIHSSPNWWISLQQYRLPWSTMRYVGKINRPLLVWLAWMIRFPLKQSSEFGCTWSVVCFSSMLLHRRPNQPNSLNHRSRIIHFPPKDKLCTNESMRTMCTPEAWCTVSTLQLMFSTLYHNWYPISMTCICCYAHCTDTMSYYAQHSCISNALCTGYNWFHTIMR